VILGVRSEAADNCALLGYYAAISGNFLPAFRDNLSVLSPGFKVLISCRRFGTTYRLYPHSSRDKFINDVSGQPIGFVPRVQGIKFLSTFRDNIPVISSQFKG